MCYFYRALFIGFYYHELESVIDILIETFYLIRGIQDYLVSNQFTYVFMWMNNKITALDFKGTEDVKSINPCIKPGTSFYAMWQILQP